MGLNVSHFVLDPLGHGSFDFLMYISSPLGYMTSTPVNFQLSLHSREAIPTSLSESKASRLEIFSRLLGGRWVRRVELFVV